MIEHEKTFLVKEVPDLSGCESEKIKDIYVPSGKRHPKIRIRRKGDERKITKKSPEDEKDSSKQTEQTISLTEEEFKAFEKMAGKELEKTRYYMDWKGRTAEIDVFEKDLEGLVLVEFEFEDEQEKKEFDPPDFCLSDVTQEEFIAGGMLCGKSYEDIRPELEGYGYNRLEISGKE